MLVRYEVIYGPAQCSPLIFSLLVEQRGNPILKAIQGIGWEYGDIVPDYQVGANTCVLFLSCVSMQS